MPKALSAISLTVCLIVDNSFKNQQIWSRYIQDAKCNNISIQLVVMSMEPSYNAGIAPEFLPEIDPSSLSEIDRASAHSMGYRRLLVSLALLEAAFKKNPDSSHFALICGDAIPIASASDSISQLSQNESWLSFPDRIAFTNEKSVKVNWMGNGENGVDLSKFDQASFVRIERFGLLFCNHHLNLLNRINSEIGVKFSQFWSKMRCFYKDDAINTYYATALALLGYHNSHNIQSSQSSYISCKRVSYPHFVGHENEDKVENAVFDISSLSIDMIREFRSSGSLFAMEFEEKESTDLFYIQNWVNLVIMKVPNSSSVAFFKKDFALDGSNDFYCSSRNIIRYSGSPVDFDAVLAGYLNTRLSSSDDSGSGIVNINDDKIKGVSSGVADGILVEDESIPGLGKRARDDMESNSTSGVEGPAKIRAIGDVDSVYRCYWDAISDIENKVQLAKGKTFRNVKIVINSHIRYKTSLSVLLQSIIDSDVGYQTVCDSSFIGKCFAWEVIVSVAGCDEDIAPRRVPITEVADVIVRSAGSASEPVEVPYITVVHSKLNSFDWTGKAALFKYRDVSSMISDYYIYMLDTSKVDARFKAISSQLIPVINVMEVPVADKSGAKTTRLIVRSTDKFREKLFLTPHPHSSTTVFGRGVISNWAHNFDRAISKNDGLTLEVFEKPIYHADGFVQHGITRFGDVTRLQNRRKLPDPCDWYSSAAASTAAAPLRTIYSYPQLGIYKAILVGYNQDGSSVTALKLSANIVGK